MSIESHELSSYGAESRNCTGLSVGNVICRLSSPRCPASACRTTFTGGALNWYYEYDKLCSKKKSSQRALVYGFVAVSMPCLRRIVPMNCGVRLYSFAKYDMILLAVASGCSSLRMVKRCAMAAFRSSSFACCCSVSFPMSKKILRLINLFLYLQSSKLEHHKIKASV